MFAKILEFCYLNMTFQLILILRKLIHCWNVWELMRDE